MVVFTVCGLNSLMVALFLYSCKAGNKLPNRVIFPGPGTRLISLDRYKKHLDVFRKKVVEHPQLERRCCVVW